MATGLIAQTVRARGQRLTLSDATGEARKVRGIVGRGGDEETAGLGNPLATPDLQATFAAEDVQGVTEGHKVGIGASQHGIRGIVDQGDTIRLVLTEAIDAAA